MSKKEENVAANLSTEVVVLGGGPGGYTAAFRAADLGKRVLLVERSEALGGVCLHAGCIPSKALLHAADVVEQARGMASLGVRFGAPELDLDLLREGQQKLISRLSGGLTTLAKQRGVQVVHGGGYFLSDSQMGVETSDGVLSIRFEQAVIACGSRPLSIPGFPEDDPRLIDSTGALALEDIPPRMLIVGGGIIGLEMATVYCALGSRIDIVELQPGLIPGCDRDLTRPLQKRLAKRCERLMLGTRVTCIEPRPEGLRVSFEGKGDPAPACYDKVLVAVGRLPNGKLISAHSAGVEVDEHGFIAVDPQRRTNVSHIFAVGDVTGGPMLAHKAAREAKVAAEAIAGRSSRFEPAAVPAVAYTDPEIAWAGLTETKAKEAGIEYEKGAFPWAASGRALGIGRDEGLTKLLFDPASRRILGAGIVGPNAGELIGEAVLALEMGAAVEDLSLTIHPHPTLCETIGFAAEMVEGSITDLLPPGLRGRRK